MKYVVCMLLMLATTIGYADCTVQCPVTADTAGAYFNEDHFSWSDPKDTTHVFIAMSGALVIATALNRYTTLKPWQSALLGAVAMGLIGTTKEVMFDSYTMRTDIKTYWAGGLAGGLMFTVLTF